MKVLILVSVKIFPILRNSAKQLMLLASVCAQCVYKYVSNLIMIVRVARHWEFCSLLFVFLANRNSSIEGQ